MADAPIAARRPVEDRPVRVVSARPSVRHRLKAIWDSRELLFYFVVTDIKIKYKSSVLGLVWSLFAPALTLGVYYLVFSVLLHNGIPNFVIFLFAGLLIWNFFFNTVSASTGIIVERAAIVKKVAFPREILALSTVGTSLIYFCLQATVMVLFMAVVGHAPDWGLLWLLPVGLIAVAAVGAALGVFLSAVNVYLRDVKHLIEVFLQLWFFLTPIVYSFQNTAYKSLNHRGITWLYLCNPVAPLVMTFQRVIYANGVVDSTVKTTPATVLKMLPTWPATTYLAIDGGLIVLGVIGFLVAVAIFGRLEGNFAEEL